MNLCCKRSVFEEKATTDELILIIEKEFNRKLPAMKKKRRDN